MKFLVELALFASGFFLGLWYATMLLLPVFYGIPKALLGYFRRQLSFKAVLFYLIAPFLWTVFLMLIILGLAFFWNNAFEYVRTSGGFNLGQTLGTLMLVLNVLFDKKTRADMKNEFDRFVLPYKRRQ
jgi:hypothetical protein